MYKKTYCITERWVMYIYAPFKHTLKSSHSLYYFSFFSPLHSFCIQTLFSFTLDIIVVCLWLTLFVKIYMMLSLFMLPILLFHVIYQFMPSLFISSNLVYIWYRKNKIRYECKYKFWKMISRPIYIRIFKSIKPILTPKIMMFKDIIFNLQWKIFTLDYSVNFV